MRALALCPLLFGLRSLADTLISRNFPHLIIPVSRLEPDRVFNTQEEFDIERDVWTEMSFDPPVNGATWCAFHFELSLDAPWWLWGYAPYTFNISSITPTMNKDTDTWNNRPQPIELVASIEIFPDGNTTMYGGIFGCKKGEPAQFLLQPSAPEANWGIRWFELDAPLNGITYDMYV